MGMISIIDVFDRYQAFKVIPAANFKPVNSLK